MQGAKEQTTWFLLLKPLPRPSPESVCLTETVAAAFFLIPMCKQGPVDPMDTSKAMTMYKG